jgi:hypothetical protein
MKIFNDVETTKKENESSNNYNTIYHLLFSIIQSEKKIRIIFKNQIKGEMNLIIRYSCNNYYVEKR